MKFIGMQEDMELWVLGEATLTRGYFRKNEEMIDWLVMGSLTSVSVPDWYYLEAQRMNQLHQLLKWENL